LALLLIGHCVTSVAPFYKRPSLCEEPGEDIEEFFMNRLVRLSGKESDTALSLHEFNWYIPHIHTSKDKRQLAWIVDMTRYHNAALGMQDPSIDPSIHPTIDSHRSKAGRDSDPHMQPTEKSATPQAISDAADIIVEGLHCLQRLLGYRLNYLEVPRLPNLLRVLIDTLRSDCSRYVLHAISRAVALGSAYLLNSCVARVAEWPLLPLW
jgi:hypothetical protein